MWERSFMRQLANISEHALLVALRQPLDERMYFFGGRGYINSFPCSSDIQLQCTLADLRLQAHYQTNDAPDVGPQVE